MAAKTIKNVDWYVSEIKRAREKRKKIAREYEWDLLKETINSAGMYVEITPETVQQIDKDFTATGYVNWPWAFKEAFVPAVYSKHPTVYAFPARTMFKENAYYVQSVVNAMFNRNNMQGEVKKTMVDALVFGHGWLKQGWFTRYGQLPVGGGGKVPGDKQSGLDQDIDFAIDDGYAYRVSPEQMLVDPEATRYEDIRWMAQEYYHPLENVQRDPMLKHTDNIPALTYTEKEGEEKPSIFQTPVHGATRSWCRVYEIWDIEDDKVHILCNGSKKFNRTQGSWPYNGIRGYPYKFLSFSDAIDKFYPPSIILPWLPLVNELGELRSLRMEHMRKMINKICNEENNIDEKEIDKMNDPACDYFEVRDISKIKDFQGLRPDPNVYACEDRCEQTIKIISGFNDLISGQIPFSKIAATTSAIAAQHSAVRFQHAGQIVRDFLLECAKDMFSIIREYQDFPITVRITGDPKADLIDIDKKQIEGEFTFDILVEDLSQLSKQDKIKAAYDDLVALAPFNETKNRVLISKYLEARGYINSEEFMYAPMGDPVDPMYENSLMAQGMEVPVNPREDFQLHLEVHNQWVSTPAYQQLTAQFPEIRNIVSRHIQLTNRQFEAMQGAQGTNGPPKAGVSPTIQQGQRLVTSSPPMGTKNRAGAGGGISATI